MHTTHMQALGVGAPNSGVYYPHPYWTEEGFIQSPCVDLGEGPMPPTLDEAATALGCYAHAEALHMGANISDVPALRLVLRKAMADANVRIVANFYRAAADQEGYGHFSPLAAYNPGTTCALSAVSEHSLVASHCSALCAAFPLPLGCATHSLRYRKIPDADKVLLLDVARYKYPPTWFPTAVLFAALNTTDSGSGVTRGLVRVRAGT